MSYSARRVGATAVRTSAKRAPAAIYPGKIARTSIATFKVPTVNNEPNVSDATGGASERIGD